MNKISRLTLAISALATWLAISLYGNLVSADQFQHASIPRPRGIQTTPEITSLGQKLFHEKELSADGRTSCATCHVPSLGFSDGRQVALGSFIVRNGQSIQGRGTQNSPSLLNVAVARTNGQAPFMFHDGRAVSLPSQAVLPIANRQEMGDQTQQDVINRLRRIPGYVTFFSDAFGPKANNQNPIDLDRFGVALAAYQSTILTDLNAPVHRRMQGNLSALSPAGERGFQLFVANKCIECHPAPYFTDRVFHNNGMEYVGARVTRANGQNIRQNMDPGRANVSGQNRDVRSYKTGTLIEIQRHAPYGHSGRLTDLTRVVDHYAGGGAALTDGTRDPNIDQRVAAIRLNREQANDLLRFLEEGFSSPTYREDSAFELPALPVNYRR